MITLALTTGDPAGIGPEVTLRALYDLHEEDSRLIFIGPRTYILTYYPSLMESLKISIWQGQKEAGIYLYDTGHTGLPAPGTGSKATGEAALAAIDAAISLWKEGVADAIVTAPVDKSLVHATGLDFAGHTEYLAEKSGGDEPFMLMYSRRYRVILVSTHHSLENLPSTITSDKLEATIRQAVSFTRLVDGGGAVAVAGRDPHCGDNGAIGTFDRDVTKPVIGKLKDEGLDVHGPYAADTLFIPDQWSRYSVVVAHYHDQGLVPFKMMAFDEGVNVTLGLPLIRTSADHGTAFSLAGKGTASHTSMKEAILLAMDLAGSMNKTVPSR